MAVLLVAGLGLYLNLDKEVTLVVDGRPSTVRTLGSTVADVLEGADLSVGEHDRVRPASGTPVSDGMTVEVTRAKEITLVLNGTRRTVYIFGQTVDDVLEQINLRAGRGAFLRPSRGAAISDGTVVELREAVSVLVNVRGKSERLITNAPDVGYLLDSLGVVVKKNDEVSPSITTPLEEGVRVKVVRVSYSTKETRQSIGFGTKVRHSDKLPKGQRRVAREGVPGERVRVFRVRSENGETVRRVLLRQRLVREPVDQIVVVGTRSPNTQVGTSSWYYRDGMVAAHKTLPKGTRVRVTNLANGKTVTVVIDDRGPFVNGWIIDLSDDAFAKLAHLGTGTIRVRLEW